VRNTSIFEIWVRSRERDDAAQIANALVDAYVRNRQRLDPDNAGLNALLSLEKEQQQKLQKQQAEVNALQEELKIADGTVAEKPYGMTLTAESLRRIEASRIEASQELTVQTTLLQNLKQLREEKEDRMIQALPTVTPDQLLVGLLEQYSLVEQRRLVLEKEYGPEHTELVKANAQVKDLREKIYARVDGILLGLETKIAAEKRGLEQLELEVNKAIENDKSRASEIKPYVDAKRQLEEETQLTRFITYARITREKLDVTRLKRAQAELVDPAGAPTVSSSANVAEGTSLILFGLLLEVLGLVLLRSKPPVEPTLCPA
jgi:uncharacterized protein involved in exopolysaccharide biosynthesis